MLLLLQVAMTTIDQSEGAFFKKKNCDLRVDAFVKADLLNGSHNISFSSYCFRCYFSYDCLESLIFLVSLLKICIMLLLNQTLINDLFS